MKMADVSDIMGNMSNLMGGSGQKNSGGASGVLGQSGTGMDMMLGQTQRAAVPSNGKGKIKTSVARKLFGDDKAKLAMEGAEVSNVDGDILTYENGSFYLA
jgi:hypothetical protein